MADFLSRKYSRRGVLTFGAVAGVSAMMPAQRFFSTFFDVSFSFEIVNGEPVVKSK